MGLGHRRGGGLDLAGGERSATLRETVRRPSNVHLRVITMRNK